MFLPFPSVEGWNRDTQRDFQLVLLPPSRLGRSNPVETHTSRVRRQMRMCGFLCKVRVKVHCYTRCSQCVRGKIWKGEGKEDKR